MPEAQPPIRNFAQLLQAAREVASQHGPRRIAIAAAAQRESVLAAVEAWGAGLARSILVGSQRTIHEIADAEGVDISALQIVDEPDPLAAAALAARLVGRGEADFLMKGGIETAHLMRAGLSQEAGLRTGRLLSHVGVFQMHGYHRLILLTDAGVVVAPTLEQKVEIIENAVAVAHRLGIELPRVAVLAASEQVHLKIRATVEAAILSKMADRQQITGCVVDGPMAIDTAMSGEAARLKGLLSPVAGRADILVAPDIEAGNLLAKTMIHFAGGTLAGVVMGARSPFVVVSRADAEISKLVSMALAVLMTAPRSQAS
ncbi:MAG: bifunctional enoyl-CoA hydratase/phosphate acetyltransferase [Chloroflexota bacterium]